MKRTMILLLVFSLLILSVSANAAVFHKDLPVSKYLSHAVFGGVGR